MATTRTKSRIYRPHIHVETSNLSFLQVAKDLQGLGIKNNKFFLVLYDRDLIHVNPHDPNLSKEMIGKIIAECVINPWYFKREVVRIEAAGAGSRGVPYILNRGNLAASWCFYNHIMHYLVLPRQIGKTQCALSDIDHAFLLGTNNTEFSFTNINQPRASANLLRLKTQREMLPPYLQFRIKVTTDGKLDSGTNNTLSIINPVTKNKIVATASPTSVEKAEEIGRGTTTSVIYIDEFEYIKYVDTLMAAIGPAYINTAKMAKQNGAAHCIILTSTPGDLDSVAGKSAMQIVNGTVPFTEKMYDWTPEHIDEYIRLNSDNRIVYIEYSYQQLGKDEEWFRETCVGVQLNPMKIKREILLHRLRGSELSPYDPKDLEAINELIKEPIEEILINKYFILSVYEPLDRNVGYIIGVDVASGTNKDDSAITILDPRYCRPVAEFKSNNISIPQLRDLLRTIVIKYCPRSVLAIERNNQGIALIQLIMETDIVSRIYYDNRKIHEADLKIRFDKNGWQQHHATLSGELGIWTGKDSREAMFDLLENHILEHKDRLATKNIMNNLFGLVRDKKGKILAGEGEKDDSIMSYNIAIYVYYYGKNLAKFGISKAKPLSENHIEREVIEENSREIYEYMREQGMEVVEYSDKSYEEEILQRELARIRQEKQMYRYDPNSRGYAESEDYYEHDDGTMVYSPDNQEDSDIFDLFYNPDNYK